MEASPTPNKDNYGFYFPIPKESSKYLAPNYDDVSIVIYG